MKNKYEILLNYYDILMFKKMYKKLFHKKIHSLRRIE